MRAFILVMLLLCTSSIQADDKAISFSGLSIASSDQADTASRGLLVVDVEPGSEADKAGVAKDDVILRMGGKPLPTLAAFVEWHPRIAGSKVRVDLLRMVENRRKQKSATLLIPKKIKVPDGIIL